MPSPSSPAGMRAPDWARMSVARGNGIPTRSWWSGWRGSRAWPDARWPRRTKRAGCWDSRPGRARMAFDLLIKNGTIIDGSGMPRFGGDVGVRDGRVVEIGRLTGAAQRTIDADGLVVAPGIIDVH